MSGTRKRSFYADLRKLLIVNLTRAVLANLRCSWVFPYHLFRVPRLPYSLANCGRDGASSERPTLISVAVSLHEGVVIFDDFGDAGQERELVHPKTRHVRAGRSELSGHRPIFQRLSRGFVGRTGRPCPIWLRAPQSGLCLGRSFSVRRIYELAAKLEPLRAKPESVRWAPESEYLAIFGAVQCEKSQDPYGSLPW